MTVARFLLMLPAVVSVAGLLLSTPAAFAQGTQSENQEKKEKNCRVLTAKRGESAREVPDKELTPGKAGNFPFLIDDTHLREDFQVDQDRRRACMSYFGIQNAASAAAAAAAAAAAPGGVAAVGAGLAGIGTISAGAIALGSFVVITTGTAIGIASGGGKSGQSNSATSTTNNPP